MARVGFIMLAVIALGSGCGPRLRAVPSADQKVRLRDGTATRRTPQVEMEARPVELSWAARQSLIAFHVSIRNVSDTALVWAPADLLLEDAVVALEHQAAFQQAGHNARDRGRAQLQAAGITPAWQPREQPRTQPLSRASRRVNAGLAARIARQFNRSEIGDLAYEFGFIPEDIKGETATAHARELTDLAWRRGLSEALAKRVIELRGNE